MNPLWTPSVQQAATSASAMLLTAIGLIAVLQRGQWLITLLFASAFLALGALQAGALGLLRATTTDGAHVWADYLARVSALLSWLWLSLSVLLGRPEPRRQLREAGAPLALSLVACVLLFLLARSSLVLDSVAMTPDGVVISWGRSARPTWPTSRSRCCSCSSTWRACCAPRPPRASAGSAGSSSPSWSRS
jgi:hypothetical protein